MDIDRAIAKFHATLEAKKAKVPKRYAPDGSVIPPLHFTKSPDFISHGQLKPFQVTGLNFLIANYEQGVRACILGDEMGLGKTLQTIAFIATLRRCFNVSGPHLIVVPKITLVNWQNEFRQWFPEAHVVVFYGTKEERAIFAKDTLKKGQFDICLTTYDCCLREKSALKDINWQCFIMDEAHRIKNSRSVLAGVVRLFRCQYRLLLTGTPLQNSLVELWSLLNFVLPEVFTSSKEFEAWFELPEIKTADRELELLESGDEADEEEETSFDEDNVSSREESPATPPGNVAGSSSAATHMHEDSAIAKQKRAQEQELVEKIQQLLRPFFIRRLKSEVLAGLLPPKKEVYLYAPLSAMQRRLYASIIGKDIESINDIVGKKAGMKTLRNTVMDLRKCCSHPYLFGGEVDELYDDAASLEHIVLNSGKLLLLDKLLDRLLERGSRVIIFCQFVMMMDILKDYFEFRGHEYVSIDGSSTLDERTEAIDSYNAPNSSKFIFLCSTRAGGVGINLTTADTVIFYESDWNPKTDMQAMDRAHRIGQKKPVMVYRLLTENTLEEEIIKRCVQKLRLDAIVLATSGDKAGADMKVSKEDMLSMVRKGAQDILNAVAAEGSAPAPMIQFDLDSILQRGEEKTREIEQQFSNAGLADIQKFSLDTSKWNGNADAEEAAENVAAPIFVPSALQKPALEELGRGTRLNAQPRLPQMAKQIQILDFQFPPARLHELQRKQLLFHKRASGYKVPYHVKFVLSPEEVAKLFPDVCDEIERQRKHQLEVDNAAPLTPDEEEEADALFKVGFSDWSRRDFSAFIRACGRHGRDNLDAIGNDVQGKTPEEVRAYAAVFWDRYEELQDFEKIIQGIEKEEARMLRQTKYTTVLQDFMSRFKNPETDLVIPYPNKRGKDDYSEAEDRFLLACLYRLGYGADRLYEQMHREIIKAPIFQFDFFIKTRSSLELSRRCLTLLKWLERVDDEDRKEESRREKLREKQRAYRRRKRGEESLDVSPTAKNNAASSSAKKESSKRKSESEDENTIDNGKTSKRSRSSPVKSKVSYEEDTEEENVDEESDAEDDQPISKLRKTTSPKKSSPRAKANRMSVDESELMEEDSGEPDTAASRMASRKSTRSSARLDNRSTSSSPTANSKKSNAPISSQRRARGSAK